MKLDLLDSLASLTIIELLVTNARCLTEQVPL